MPGYPPASRETPHKADTGGPGLPAQQAADHTYRPEARERDAYQTHQTAPLDGAFGAKRKPASCQPRKR